VRVGAGVVLGSSRLISTLHAPTADEEIVNINVVDLAFGSSTIAEVPTLERVTVLVPDI
jgi:hypothetical protein